MAARADAWRGRRESHGIRERPAIRSHRGERTGHAFRADPRGAVDEMRAMKGLGLAALVTALASVPALGQKDLEAYHRELDHLAAQGHGLQRKEPPRISPPPKPDPGDGMFKPRS